MHDLTDKVNQIVKTLGSDGGSRFQALVVRLPSAQSGSNQDFNAIYLKY